MFHRRIREKNCFVGNSLVEPNNTETCACADVDFEWCAGACALRFRANFSAVNSITSARTGVASSLLAPRRCQTTRAAPAMRSSGTSVRPTVRSRIRSARVATGQIAALPIAVLARATIAPSSGSSSPSLSSRARCLRRTISSSGACTVQGAFSVFPRFVCALIACCLQRYPPARLAVIRPIWPAFDAGLRPVVPPWGRRRRMELGHLAATAVCGRKLVPLAAARIPTCARRRGRAGVAVRGRLDSRGVLEDVIISP